MPWSLGLAVRGEGPRVIRVWWWSYGLVCVVRIIGLAVCCESLGLAVRGEGLVLAVWLIWAKFWASVVNIVFLEYIMKFTTFLFTVFSLDSIDWPYLDFNLSTWVIYSKSKKIFWYEPSFLSICNWYYYYV